MPLDPPKTPPTQAEQARDFAESIVATVREPILVLDATLHVAFANRAFYTAFEVTPEETAGRLLYELGNGQWDIPALRHLLEEIIPSDSEVSDFVVVHAFPTLGTRRMLLNARKVWRPGNHSELLLLSVEDVTGRDRLQESLRHNERQLRLLVEGATDYAMFLIDEGGIVRSWNVGAERIIGYTEEQIVGQPVDIIFTPEDRADDMPQWELSRADKNGRAEDRRWHLRRDGTRFFADGLMMRLKSDEGEPQGFAKILRDVTERVRIENNLRETEERLRFATNAARVGTWDYYPQTGELVWDDRCKAFFGLPADAPVTLGTYIAGLHPDDVEPSSEAISEALRSGGDGKIDHVFRTVTGVDQSRVRHIHSMGRAFFDGNGLGYRLIGIVQDITEQKRLEAELSEAARKNERIAETLQKSLLLAPLPDAYPGIALKSFYESAWDDALIGGDFFDVFAVAENVVGIVVGDVTGKGLEAATYTAEIKFILRGFLRETGDPADAITRLNRFVVDAERLDAAHLGSTYIAISLACVNTLTGKVTCVTAGSEPPLFFRPGASGAEAVPPGGLMLGVSLDIGYSASEFQMESGDLYVAYTDGITEARRNKEFWGQEGLVDVVIETAFTRNESLAVVGDEVARRAKAWANGRQQDDVCLIIVRRL